MSLSFSRYVRFISISVPFFRCQSFPYILSCRLVSSSFVSLSFPCTPVVFISVPFMSLSVPLCFPFMSPCFPVMSTSYFLPSFPCTSLHFPFARISPRKKTRFSYRFRAKGGKKPKPAKSWQGDSSLGPLLRHRLRKLRLVERHHIAARYVGDTPSLRRIRRRAGRGGGGGSSFKYPTHLRNVGGLNWQFHNREQYTLVPASHQSYHSRIWPCMM